MNNEKLQDILLRIKFGDQDKIYLIINMYKGLIEKNSIIDGKLDEDCKSFIVERLIKELKNKKINNY